MSENKVWEENAKRSIGTENPDIRFISIGVKYDRTKFMPVRNRRVFNDFNFPPSKPVSGGFWGAVYTPNAQFRSDWERFIMEKLYLRSEWTEKTKQTSTIFSLKADAKIFWVYDYFDDLMKREYFELMDYEEKDIFNRLRQSYTLQIRLLEKYPWITEFHKLLQITRSEEINKEISNRKQNPDCYSNLFEGIDTVRFKDGLDIEMCKLFILWTNIGFTNQLLKEIRSGKTDSVDSNNIHKKLDRYFNELRNVFYTTNDE